MLHWQVFGYSWSCLFRTGDGVDEIDAEDEKQSENDNGKEEVAPATQSDADEPGPVITESDITSSAPAPQETEGSCFLSHTFSAIYLISI